MMNIHNETFNDKNCILEVLTIRENQTHKYSVEESQQFTRMVSDQMDID